MITHLRVAGALMIALASVHVIFPRYFNWREDLAPLSLINRQLMWVHTFFVALVVLLIGILSIAEASSLVSTELGRSVTLGVGIFWGCRLVLQWFGYSWELWRGKRFETIVHVAFTLLWSYFTALYLYAAFSSP